MTIIAYDRKSISVDSRQTSGDFICGKVQKWMQLPDGGMAFGCGQWGDIQAIFSALRNSETPEPSHYSEVCIVTVDSKGKVWEQDGTPFKERITRPTAWGTGREVAQGALMAGADSNRAAQIACEFLTSCGGPVHTFQVR